MSSHDHKPSPEMLGSPLPSIPINAITSPASKRETVTSDLSARSKEYRETLRMPAMIPPSEDDDKPMRIFNGNEVSATLDTVDIKEAYKDRYMETDAAKVNAAIGLPEVRIKSKRLIVPQPSSPKHSMGSMFGSLFSKSTSKGYSLEDLTRNEHPITPKLISSPKLVQQKHGVRVSDFENDESDEIMINPAAEQAKYVRGRSKRKICLVLFVAFLISAVAGVAIALTLGTNLDGDGQSSNNGIEGLTPTASPIILVATASPLTTLPTKSPTRRPTEAPTEESTLATKTPTEGSTFVPTKSPTKKLTRAPTPAPTLGSVSLPVALRLCSKSDPNTLICINSDKFFTCGSDKKPEGSQQPPIPVVLKSCSGTTSCACTPLAQFVASTSDICTIDDTSASCQDIF